MAVAQFGLMEDIPQARRFLELRAIRPCAEVTTAMLKLFDAFVAQRQGNHTEVLQHAAAAAKRFEILGWHGDAHIARMLLPATTNVSGLSVSEIKAFADLPVFTAREQQIAELVLKGLTNRAIADALSIKERTVETHMTSIMSHLGIRSRHQLVDHLTQDKLQLRGSTMRNEDTSVKLIAREK